MVIVGGVLPSSLMVILKLSWASCAADFVAFCSVFFLFVPFNFVFVLGFSTRIFFS